MGEGEQNDDGRTGPLTGDACVSALIRMGFRVRHRADGLVLLARSGSIVMVPDVGVIEPFMLKAILRSAGITQTELDAHLAHVPLRSGFFTKAAVPRDGTATPVETPRRHGKRANR